MARDIEKTGFILYYDKFELLDQLDDAGFRAIIRAFYHYSKTGTVDVLDNPALNVIFGMLRQAMDASERKTAERSKSAQSAANNRWSPTITAADIEKNACEPMRNDAECMRSDANSMRSDAEGMRTHAEGMRIDAEHMRTDAECMRTDAEGMRSDAERCLNIKQETINNKQETINNNELHHPVDARARGNPFSDDYEPADPDPVVAYAARCLVGMSPNNVDELVSFRDVLPDDLIIHAIDETAASGARAYRYTRTILNRYVRDGIRTIAEAQAADDKRKEAKTSGVNTGHPEQDEDLWAGFTPEQIKINKLAKLKDVLIMSA